jgi:hypothetical protein
MRERGSKRVLATTPPMLAGRLLPGVRGLPEHWGESCVSCM